MLYYYWTFETNTLEGLDGIDQKTQDVKVFGTYLIVIELLLAAGEWLCSKTPDFCVNVRRAGSVIDT